MTSPYGYQQEVIDSVGKDNALLAMGLGTGKTNTATWLALQGSHDKVLIVAPIRTFDGWVRTVMDLVGVPLREVTNKRKAGRANLDALRSGQNGWYFCGWEYMRSLNTEKRWDGNAEKFLNKSVTKPFNGVVLDLVIADEWHRASNSQSQNFQVISRIKAGRRLALSATPAGDKPVNIYAAYAWLWPDRFTSFHRFGKQFFHSEVNHWAITEKSMRTGRIPLVYTREKRPGSVRQMVPHHVLVPADKAYPDMPEVNVQRVLCKMTREQSKQYDEWVKEAVAWFDDNPVAIDIPMHMDMRLRQATLGELSIDGQEEVVLPNGMVTTKPVISYAADCKSGKIDALLDVAKDLGDEKQVVYCHSKKFLVPLKYRLDKAGLSWVEVSGDDRDSWRRFRDDPSVQFLLAVIPAVAEGVDGLQKVCHIEHWLSEDNRVVLNLQATGRLHRGGQTQRVTRYLYQCEGTVDTTAIVPRLEEKYSNLKSSGLV